MYTVILAGISIFAPSLVGQIASEATVPMPAFPMEWGAMSLGNATHDQKPIGVVVGRNGMTYCLTDISNVPTDRNLTFHVWLRSPDADKTIAINSFASGPNQKLLASHSVSVPVAKGSWVKATSEFVAPRGATTVRICVIQMDAKDLQVSDPVLTAGGPKLVALDGDGVLQASSGMVVSGSSGTLLFPIPGPTGEQAPVAFQVHTEPANALKGFEIKRRVGDNWVCEAHLVPSADKPTTVRWNEILIVREKPRPALPTVKISTEPNELRGWLASTPVVQADQSDIKQKAAELRLAAHDDLTEFVRNVSHFTSTNQGTGKAFVALDAGSAIGCGGSCTSRANLAAALLRAGGVPARTVSHLPTWAYGSPMYEHWVTEYWHPGVGWVAFDGTMNDLSPRASVYVPLATASIADELKTGHPGQLGWIMPGAAWMSGIQAEGELIPAQVDENTADGNWCRPERRMEVSKPLFDAAVAWWPHVSEKRFAARDQELALNGTPAQLMEALLSDEAKAK